MDWFQTILGYLPTSAELVTAIPVILSLILIEGLLSVDNAMAIAAMASNLPKHQQKLALKLGIIGAYAFRGICLFLVAWIINNPWLKIAGAAYLIYLMNEHVLGDEEDENNDGVPDGTQRGLVATIIQIEIMDLSLSLDNVVAAVALDKRLWVVCTGVFIGILALRFVAGYCIKLIERYPVLKKTAFLLVGFVGSILLTEISLEYAGIHFDIGTAEKFSGIIAITLGSLWYTNSSAGYRVLHPVVVVFLPIMMLLRFLLSIPAWPFVKLGAIMSLAWQSIFGKKSVQTT